MAITDKEQGVWDVDEVYNKINQGSIWEYSSNVTALKSWGRNRFGYLGHDTADPGIQGYSSPTQISGTTWETIPIATSGENPWGSMAVKTDGTLWVWGSSARGALGNNVPTTEYSSSPTQVGTDTTWSDGAWGPYGFRMIKTDGTLWGTGQNQAGQLGQNDIRTPSYSGYSSPTQIPGTTWSQVVTGTSNNFGIKTDGTLWGWGGHGYGALGLNDNSARSSPTQITGTWSVVRMWNYGAHAVKTDGTLWSWGVNYGGQCGLNQTSPGAENSPSQVGSDTTWGQTIDTLGAGRDNALSIKTDGTLWMWGYNTVGQLGQNSIINYSSPVQVGTDTTWRSSNTNQYATFATKTDGTLWTWGQNDYGYLGQNNVVKYSSPTQIPGIWESRIGGAGEGVSILEIL
tara:strand:- start:407 stop:1606 length:1200 start_codon:yes stop_codon:yes gene_type:complete